SPGSSTLDIGPLSIHFYGLTLLAAIAAAVGITGLRWTRRGGDWDLIFRVAVWGVAFGIVGARLYHVVTSWDELPDAWWGPFAIWKGGLGVWGGIGLGCAVGAIVAHRSGASVALLADCVAPGLLVAQGIGRFGNWWNQELFGKPTDLPWGLKLSPSKVPVGYPADTTFHPTFLYESLWNFALCGFLLWIDRRYRLRPGRLFLVYLAGYGSGRFWVESLRIDPAHSFGGLRLNQWVALVIAVAAAALLIVDRQRHRRVTEVEPHRPLASTGVSDRITPEVVVKVARLARLDLTAHEIERTTAQLAGMLDHFADIDALQLDDVEPMNQPYALENVLRDDVIGPGLDRDEVLAVAPQAEEGRFRVPPIVGLES
ncbi:MAG TPA: prolipoprotein diacylglyceryl transferase, partial [Ilumatobacteraceae bacterium]|nr:prolipoprotein diacylglyceryl transferase [Ilumatobacteraceae bacterium]